ncbi:MAG: hypothetical protein HYT80_06540 [Euryarchaeota archaeon]|nr:hypothetical protein [Euryarchaeota archaeon]
MSSDRSVRLCVVGSALVVAALGSAVMLNAPVDTVDRLGGEYWGLRVLAPGPAPMGLPVIPVDVRPDGTLVGRADYLPWYRYCGREAAPGLAEGYRGGSTFVYATRPEKVARAESQGIDLWWKEELGQTARAADFPGVWRGAPVHWRSQGQEGANVVTAVVIRVDPLAYPEPFRSEFVGDGFLAATTMDMHFCCTVGYEEHTSPRARLRDDPAHSLVFDSCHDSRYDPRSIKLYEGPPHEVRP